MTTPTATTDPAAVGCTTCQRGPAQWCRTAAGAYTTPHAARLKLAAATPPPVTDPPPSSSDLYGLARFDQATYAAGEAPA